MKNSGFIWRVAFFPIAIIYLEVMFHGFIYGTIDMNIIYPVAFGGAAGLVLALLCSFFHRIANAIIGYVLFTGITVYYVAQLVYYKIFRTFLSLVSIGGAGDAMNFKSVMFAAIRSNWYAIALLMLPLIVLVCMNVFFVSFERYKKGSRGLTIKGIAVEISATAIMWAVSVSLLGAGGTGAFSPYELFHGTYVLELSMNKLGVVVTTAKDFIAMAGGDSGAKTFDMDEPADTVVAELNMTDDGIADDTEESSQAATGDNSGTKSDITEEPEEKMPVPQIDESIDFYKLYSSTDDETLKSISAYLSKVQPTYKDEYTGMFEGYNVVFVTAESLSTYGISKEATPTLYKIYHEGFEFTNFYNPLWYHSTIDGEYTTCLSQYPASSKWSFEESGSTYQPYALGNILNKQGYQSFGYHDFDATYYDRTTTHPNMGYTTFRAIGAGLDLTCYTMYSDLECMETVYEEFSAADPFNMYFMSFSGHLPYNYDLQYLCLKNREEAEAALADKNYSDEAIAYVAAQIELDKALEYVINKLDEEGRLDNTLFIVAPDHYPYGLSDGVYNELAGMDIEYDDFELHRNQFGIWSSSMTEPVVVDTLCSSVDILPTVLNLLGADFDSRLLAGRNILSVREPLVIFADQSFITDKVKYNTGTGEVTYLVPEEEVPEGYIDQVLTDVQNRLYISDEIINSDYFAYVFE